MNESDNPQRSWLERLSHALLREPQDREQLIELLRDAEQRNLLDAHALTMIEGVLQFSEMQVRDIIVPRTQIVTVTEDLSLAQLLPIVIQSGHSRFPVLNEQQDAVTGILLAKDLLSAQQHVENFKLHDILRPVLIVPESKRLDKLLQEFRINHQHMAIVIDEYGNIAGLVTIEDILEQIVGDIEDEHDFDDEAYIRKLNENTYTIKALTPIEEFNQYFQCEINDDETEPKSDTIGGVIIKAFGYLPKRGELISIGAFRFKVLHADHRRVRLLRVWRTSAHE